MNKEKSCDYTLYEVINPSMGSGDTIKKIEGCPGPNNCLLRRIKSGPNRRKLKEVDAYRLSPGDLIFKGEGCLFDADMSQLKKDPGRPKGGLRAILGRN